VTTNYRRGYEFERKVRQVLLDQGAEHVIRTAASRSPADLYAFYPPDSPLTHGLTRVHLVQCKTDGRRLGEDDRGRLVDLASRLRATAVLAS